ncbi:hypothetical protein SOVF_086240 [Spinacia oleracea]|uniref:RNA helicase n=1 Tax=Spinacia oleracea TaxID=3562 RepID=A0A9R0J925_SPIOL|nr:DEAD-box ATP-dependent RNA helicase 47, mitochondrial [Spinacia oleracea]KNA16759.1 hypothetical protein SOVF_086240 [Spinacia oleracea]
MPALLSSRLLFLVGESLPLGRLLLVPRTACYPRNVRFLSRLRNENTPLTLASLGFRDKVETSKGSEVDRVGELNPTTIEVPKRKTKLVRVKEASVNTVRNSIEIEGAPFAAESFPEIGLPPLLLRRLEEEGFTVPTDVQSTAVPTVLKGHDAVIQSYTGSGKTLAYLLPILSEVGPLKKKQSGIPEDSGKKKDVEAVIVAPSRELGMQIVREVEKLLGPTHKRMVQQLVGGANRSRQEEALKKNKPAIVVGTPGRIAEISAAGKLHTHGCRFLVLDEVDELLAFNFREDMHRILEHVGKKKSVVGSQTGNNPRTERQTIMVSATVPTSVVRAALSWGRDPVLVRAKSVTPLDSTPNPTSGPVNSVNSKNSNSPSPASSESLPPLLKHYYCTARLQHKVDTLRRCVHALDAKYVIVFMNLNRQLKDTVYKLEARGIQAAELHGDLNKLARSTVLKKFKNGELRILVTNELAARGLDVAECDLVVNFDLPTDSIHYAHRAGRTGRLGRKGVVVSICEQHEVFVMKKIQKQLGVAIQSCEFVEGKLLVEEEMEKRSTEHEENRGDQNLGRVGF